MFKKTITYTDFNDNQHTQDFYFHLSKAELLAMAADGQMMMDRINNIIAAKDGRAILAEFKNLIVEAVGVRSEDGLRFIKDDNAKSSLMDSPAFDELLMELATNENAASHFIQELIPEKMRKEMLEQLKSVTPAPDPFKHEQVGNDDTRPAWLKEGRNPTEVEILGMSKEELQLAFHHRK